MAGRAVLDGSSSRIASNLSVLLQNQSGPCSSQPIDALLLSGSPSLLGSTSMVSFGDVQVGKGCNSLFFRSFDHDENGDDGMDEYFHQPEKKRRLSADQVRSLEKSFELENKLEHERKVQLAKDLGLQPRQVAIWFQNRRARWKTKQMEKDYDSLQACYDSLEADYENLLREKDRLKAEVVNLTEKVRLREKQEGNFSQAETNELQEPPQKPLSESTASEGEGSKVSAKACKQEDIISAKCDIFDSDRPRYTDGVHSSLLEAGDSSYAFEPTDQSDLSQDAEDNLSKSFLPPYVFPKLEVVDYSDPSDSCNFGFPVVDQAFWSSLTC